MVYAIMERKRSCLMQTEFKIPESVLVVIFSDDLKVLLLERADRPGFWQSVTGSKDTIDESPRQVAMREVREETGIIVRSDTSMSGAHNSTLVSVPEMPERSKGHVPEENLLDWHLSNVFEIYPVWRHRYAPGVSRNTEHVFSLKVPENVPVVLSPREHLQYCWLPYREAADRCFSSSNAEAILQLPIRIR